jgi:hypothetical protein
MFKIIFTMTLLLVTTTALAQIPIPRQGDSCPSGTYKSGDYCKPFKSTTDRGDTIINKSGDRCPTGFYKSGNYCKASGGGDKQVLTREPGAKCPTGWYKSDGYYTKYGRTPCTAWYWLG